MCECENIKIVPSTGIGDRKKKIKQERINVEKRYNNYCEERRTHGGTNSHRQESNRKIKNERRACYACRSSICVPFAQTRKLFNTTSTNIYFAKEIKWKKSFCYWFSLMEMSDFRSKQWKISARATHDVYRDAPSPSQTNPGNSHASTFDQFRFCSVLPLFLFRFLDFVSE